MNEIKKKRALWEIVLVVVVLLAVVGVAYGYFYFQEKAENEKALIYQLKTLRTAVQIYITTYNQKPQNMKDLYYRTSDKSEKNAIKLNWNAFEFGPEGEILDAFGNPFIYNPESGWIKTQTKNYESW